MFQKRVFRKGFELTSIQEREYCRKKHNVKKHAVTLHEILLV